MLLHVRAGQNYGFPSCDWSTSQRLRELRPPVASCWRRIPTRWGSRCSANGVYFNEYGGREGAKVVWIAQSGGTIHKAAVGFGGLIVGLGQHGGRLYVGKTSGQIYRFTPTRS